MALITPLWGYYEDWLKLSMQHSRFHADTESNSINDNFCCFLTIRIAPTQSVPDRVSFQTHPLTHPHNRCIQLGHMPFQGCSQVSCPLVSPPNTQQQSLQTLPHPLPEGRKQSSPEQTLEKARFSRGIGGRRLAKWGSRGPGSSAAPLPLLGLLCPPFPHSQASPLQVAQAAASGVQGDVLREICEHIKGTSAVTMRLCKE